MDAKDKIIVQLYRQQVELHACLISMGHQYLTPLLSENVFKHDCTLAGECLCEVLCEVKLAVDRGDGCELIPNYKEELGRRISLTYEQILDRFAGPEFGGLEDRSNNGKGLDIKEAGNEKNLYLRTLFELCKQRLEENDDDPEEFWPSEDDPFYAAGEILANNGLITRVNGDEFRLVGTFKEAQQARGINEKK